MRSGHSLLRRKKGRRKVFRVIFDKKPAVLLPAFLCVQMNFIFIIAAHIQNVA